MITIHFLLIIQSIILVVISSIWLVCPVMMSGQHVSKYAEVSFVLSTEIMYNKPLCAVVHYTSYYIIHCSSLEIIDSVTQDGMST